MSAAPLFDDRPAELLVRRWSDPLVDRVGVPVDSAYAELFWLPTLGPSSTWLLRRLAASLDDAEAATFDLPDLGRSLGLSASTARQAPLARAFRRLVGYGVARHQLADGALLVRTRLGTIPARQLARLPESLQARHAALVGAGR